MKKTFSLALSLIMIIASLTALPFTALADESGKCGENLTYFFESASGSLTVSGTGAMYDFDEDNPEYYPKKAYINTVTFESGVTHIGNYAFSNCSNITMITVPDTVTSIGKNAFANCYNLDSVIYGGTPAEWGNISVGSANTYITDMENGATVYSGGEQIFKVVYDFNGGTKDGNGTYVTYQVAYAPAITEANFIDSMGVTPPSNMNLDAIEINGERYELESGYMLNKNTTYKYLWKENHVHTFVKKITKASPGIDGYITELCSSCEQEKSEKIISMPERIILSKEDYTYDGKVKKPKVTVRDLKGKKIDKSNYTVTYSKGRKKIGTYKVTVKFKGKYYKGKMKKNFRINPKGTSITKLESTKANQFKVSWKKRTKDCSGYQIIYSTNPKFGIFYSPYPTVKGYKNTSKEIENIPENGKFYVKVRTYKTVKGKKYYSTWSKAKSVIVK